MSQCSQIGHVLLRKTARSPNFFDVSGIVAEGPILLIL